MIGSCAPLAVIKVFILESPNRIIFRRARDQLSLNEPEEVDEILRRFAAAVILSAMRDAAGNGGRDKRMDEAKAWLLDAENEIWFNIAGIQRKHILAWFEAGCQISNLHKLGVISKYTKKYYPEYELRSDPRKEKALIDPDLGIEY